MATRDPENLAEKAEIKAPQSRCDVCGKLGETVYQPDRSPPNRFCIRCAVEYGNTARGDSDDY